MGEERPQQRLQFQRGRTGGVRSAQPGLRQIRPAGRTPRRVCESELFAHEYGEGLPVQLYESISERGCVVQPERRHKSQGELLAAHSSSWNAGAESVPDILRRTERVYRQSKSESGVYRRV